MGHGRIPDAVRRLAAAVLDLEEYVEAGERPTANDLLHLEGCEEALRFLLYGEVPARPGKHYLSMPDPRPSTHSGGSTV